MPDLTGLSSVDRVPPQPAAPRLVGAGVVVLSPVTRLAPVQSGESSTGSTQPVGRSGLDLLDVLATTDLLAHREPTSVVALEVGLEQARGSLLRNLPGDALTTLDQVWDAARGTEEGWYLRSGALMVLGLPGECERVAMEGLGVRPASLALRFLQSLVRMSLGDLAGARFVLQSALQLAPNDPLLLVQQALIQAKLGDSRTADALFGRVAMGSGHPALTWGRETLRTIVADATRLRSRPIVLDQPDARPNSGARAPQSLPMVHDRIATDRIATDSIAIGSIATDCIGTDITDTDSICTDITGALSSAPTASRVPIDRAAMALERFGARVVMCSLAEVAAEARMLMRAFSAGGTLASATTAGQAHAARTLLATFLGVATGRGAKTPAPVRAMVQQLIPLLQQKRFTEAERMVRRQRALARGPIGRLLLAIVRATPFCSDASVASSTPAASGPIVRGDAEQTPVVPVRLGLGLMEETPASRASLHVWYPERVAAGTPSTIRDEGGHVTFMASGSALVCAALAAAFLVTSHAAIAVALAVGAVWLGLRPSGRAGAPSHTHDRTPAQ